MLLCACENDIGCLNSSSLVTVVTRLSLYVSIVTVILRLSVYVRYHAYFSSLLSTPTPACRMPRRHAEEEEEILACGRRSRRKHHGMKPQRLWAGGACARPLSSTEFASKGLRTLRSLERQAVRPSAIYSPKVYTTPSRLRAMRGHQGRLASVKLKDDVVFSNPAKCTLCCCVVVRCRVRAGAAEVILV